MDAVYTTDGSVCGGCGHLHRTLGAAERCADAHQRACRRQGGYSDRAVLRAESAASRAPFCYAGTERHYHPNGPTARALAVCDVRG